VSASDGLDSFAGSVFGDFIDTQLQQERDRKSSLEQRGMAIITAAGTVVTLGFTFAAFVKGSNGLDLSAPSKSLFVTSLVAFIVSGIYGVRTNQPARYAEANVDSLEGLAEADHWIWNDVPGAARRVAEVKISMIRSGRVANSEKAKELRNSIVALFAAVGLLAAALIAVLVSS